MFWFAALMYKNDITPFDGMNVALFAGMSGVSSIFVSGIFAPDIKNGQQAAKNLFKLLDYEPKIDCNSESGDKRVISGAITFDNVSFAYPNRDVKVLCDVKFPHPRWQHLRNSGDHWVWQVHCDSAPTPVL